MKYRIRSSSEEAIVTGVLRVADKELPRILEILDDPNRKGLYLSLTNWGVLLLDCAQFGFIPAEKVGKYMSNARLELSLIKEFPQLVSSFAAKEVVSEDRLGKILGGAIRTLDHGISVDGLGDGLVNEAFALRIAGNLGLINNIRLRAIISKSKNPYINKTGEFVRFTS